MPVRIAKRALVLSLSALLLTSFGATAGTFSEALGLGLRVACAQDPGSRGLLDRSVCFGKMPPLNRCYCLCTFSYVNMFELGYMDADEAGAWFIDCTRGCERRHLPPLLKRA